MDLHFLLYPIAVILWWPDADAGKVDSQNGRLVTYVIATSVNSLTNWVVVGSTTNITYTVYRDAYATSQFFRVEKVGCCLDLWTNWNTSQQQALNELSKVKPLKSKKRL